MAPLPPTLLTAAFIAPMSSPLLRNGGVLFDSQQILAVGPAATLLRDHPHALHRDLGSATILPGLVNAHTHLELSDVPQGTAPAGGFSAWLLDRIRHAAAPLSPQEQYARTAHAIDTGVQQCLRFGVTTVGDISRFSAVTRPLLAQSSLNVVSFGEVTAMASRRDQLEPRLREALAPPSASAAPATNTHLHVGVSPHAPYSVEPAGYRRCLAAAAERALPLATHLAESPDEADFLAHHAGPLQQLWATLGWDEHAPPPTFAGSPVQFAAALGLLAYPRTLLAHVNYCDDADLALLAAGRASVVYCPRTHAFFGHPPHRWREMLAAGINVAVGTDSTASSPDLNLVDDLRLLHRLAPEVPPLLLFQLATTHAAAALGLAHECGSITPGLRPDFTVFPTRTPDPLREILESDLLPIPLLPLPHPWLAGRQTAQPSRD